MQKRKNWIPLGGVLVAPPLDPPMHIPTDWIREWCHLSFCEVDNSSEVDLVLIMK